MFRDHDSIDMFTTNLNLNLNGESADRDGLNTIGSMGTIYFISLSSLEALFHLLLSIGFVPLVLGFTRDLLNIVQPSGS